MSEIMTIAWIFLLSLSFSLSSAEFSGPAGHGSSTIFGPVAHVFLIAGQSNSVGYNTDGFTSEDYSLPNILQLSCCNGTTTLPVSQCSFNISHDPLLHNCDASFIYTQCVGYGMNFARSFIQTLPFNDLIILVPAGIGGTGFDDHVWNAYTGSGFKTAVAKLKQTFSLLTNNYGQYKPVFEGILWHQGTADAGDNGDHFAANTSYYLHNDILPMIEAWRDQKLLPFTFPELPFVASQMFPSWALNATHPERIGVFNAIATIDQFMPYTASIPSGGLRGDPHYLDGDGEFLHFTARAQRILGRRYFAGWQLAKFNSPEKVPPNFHNNNKINQRKISRQ